MDIKVKGADVTELHSTKRETISWRKRTLSLRLLTHC
jgi:hypothetical protein